jgi:hypothetical protein
LATASGRVLKTVKTRVPIGEFAVSADASQIVFRPAGEEYGGPLYLLQIGSAKLERLTKECPESARCFGHVYADPDFSPTADRVVFAVHGAAHGDAVAASGPLAVIDLKTRRMHILPATMNIDGQGPAFANDPHWSPDGTQILVSFETGAAITDPEGKKLHDISELFSGGAWSNGLGWLGNQCVLYIAGAGPRDAQQGPVRALNLATSETQLLSELLGTAGQGLTGLVAFSARMRVRRDGQRLVIESDRPRWDIKYKTKSTFIKILPAQKSFDEVPAGCRP